jgi:hypothetical protein
MDIAKRGSWVWVLFMPAVVSCAGVPVEQLQAYSGAYEEAREAGSLLYERAAVAVRVAEASEIAPGAGADVDPPYLATLGPANYQTGACGFGASGSAIPESILARCQAFAAVTTYNEILLKLAAGDPAVAVRSELGQIAVALDGLQSLLAQNTTVTTLLASAGPVVGPLLGIVGEAQKLASAAAVREELEKGRPAVQAILQALRQDVPHLYAMQRDLSVTKLGVIQTNIGAIFVQAVGIVRQHQLPSAQPDAGERTAIVGRFDALLDDLELPDVPKETRLSSQPTGTTPYTAATTAALRTQFAELEQADQKYRSVAQEWHAYVEALQLYDGMLVELGESLASLGTTDVTNLFAPSGAAAQWLASAIAIRDSAREIKANL